MALDRLEIKLWLKKVTHLNSERQTVTFLDSNLSMDRAKGENVLNVNFWQIMAHPKLSEKSGNFINQLQPTN